MILTKEAVLEKSMNTVNIEEIVEDFEKLRENEDIPDWYLHEEDGATTEKTFDFGKAIERTKTFQKNQIEVEFAHESNQVPKIFEINGFPLSENVSDLQDLHDMDFAKLDKFLEEKVQRDRGQESSEEQKSGSSGERVKSSPERSKNYFKNL